MQDNRRYGSISSSQNPEEIATKVKGLVLSLSAVIILVASQIFHITLTASDVITLATELSFVAGSVVFLYGVGLHVLAYFFKTPQASA